MTTITSVLIEQALIELCYSVPFEKIRVNDICKKAGLSKQSFYNYFQDKYDVVASIYLKDIKNDELLNGGSYELVVQALNNIWEKREFYRNVFNSDGQNSLCRFARQYSIEFNSRLVIANQGRELTPEQKYAISYLAYGWVGNLIDWLRGEMDYTVEEFADIEYKTFPLFVMELWKG